YYLGGFQLKWNLFAGRQNTWKVKQANSDVLLLNDRISEAESQLRLHLTTSQNALASALKQLESSKEALTFARESYRLTAIRYENGQAIPLELTQALQQLTQAQLTLAIQQSEVRMREAELERAAASFTF
ncbi:MAG TPA: TolC family protein, partial [Flavobacteriales bacterium]|nr:TolC family protein [Flavobacteriales bacterium]